MAITSPNLLVGLRLRRALRGLRERAYDAAPRELDLEGIVRVAASFPQQHIGGAGKRGAIAASPRSAASAALSRQGLCATPPSARRASLMVPPSSSSAAAIDTSANA